MKMYSIQVPSSLTWLMAAEVGDMTVVKSFVFGRVDGSLIKIDLCRAPIEMPVFVALYYDDNYKVTSFRTWSGRGLNAVQVISEIEADYGDGIPKTYELQGTTEPTRFVSAQTDITGETVSNSYFE